MEKSSYIAVSGGFDPLHGGHVDYLESAATYGDLIVILNSDEWLIRKKGYCFMPFLERRKILMALECVHDVIEAMDDDNTVSESLRILSGIKYFGKGGDRTRYNTPESKICSKLGIKVVYGVGGQKTQSSSKLVKNVQSHH